MTQISYSRAATNTFGCVTVSIPIVHKMGEVETPKTSWFGMRKEAEADGKHFRIQKLDRLSREEFASAIANPADSLMLFVHGYNVAFSDAAFRAAQIAFDANYKGRVMMYSWPSKGGVKDYDYDRESALYAPDGLFDLLQLIKTAGKVSRIIVIAHSLGSEVVLGALQQAVLSQTALGITELIDFCGPGRGSRRLSTAREPNQGSGGRGDAIRVLDGSRLAHLHEESAIHVANGIRNQERANSRVRYRNGRCFCCGKRNVCSKSQYVLNQPRGSR
ncbi:alpha/beta hydrolase [Bradyrhizobium sp. WSM471]|uniref:alpha/beta hydrolase n=1 Tax=Bradyrhizobium sp. WSM471 TaxID=319017 RepID=UPI00024D2344|nr:MULTISPECIES: alpha/beta hydrolase [Bradyrhizobium]EHR00822.1 hypothetical protein Bra471DRAFT_01416 [Bradyrhizobium sp. WSM471]UFW42900.1 alpha/beta hydrolase [Bradyrhizobium canariense]